MTVDVKIEKVDVDLANDTNVVRVGVIFTVPYKRRFDLQKTMMAAQQRGGLMTLDAGSVLPVGFEAGTPMEEKGAWS